MNIVYAYERLPTDGITPSIFLAGPTPRTAVHRQGLATASPRHPESWRPEAIEALTLLGFSGDVLIPEPRDALDHSEQWLWEAAALEAAHVILFWVPRDMVTMPGLTTNDEWGAWKTSGKCVFGAPPGAASTSYQRWWAKRLGISTATTLLQTVILSIELSWRLSSFSGSHVVAAD